MCGVITGYRRIADEVFGASSLQLSQTEHHDIKAWSLRTMHLHLLVYLSLNVGISDGDHIAALII